MSLDPPTEETLAAIRNACEVNEETLKEAVRTIKQWLEEQPHLHSHIDDKRLELLYLKCKKKMLKVFATLDAYYSTNSAITEILQDREHFTSWFEWNSKVVYFFPMPRLTDDLCRVTVAGLIDTDPDNFNITDVTNMECIMSEVKFFEEFSPFDILIVDIGKSGPKHTVKHTLPALRSIKALLLDRFPTRLRSIHLINAPIYVSAVISVVRLVFKPKLFKKIHVHKGGLGNLHDHVPAKVLPSEYGGEAGSILPMWMSSVWISVNNEVLSVEIQPTFGGEHVASIFKVEGQTKEEIIIK